MLVAATIAAFFVAQRVKGAPPVIEVLGLPPAFSPNGDGRQDVARFAVRVKTADDLTIDVVNSDDDPVRRLAQGMPAKANRPVQLRWNGRTDTGTRAPNGWYRIRVSLEHEGRSVIVPATTRLDTVAPRPVVGAVEPGHIVGPRPGTIHIRVRHVSRRFPTQVAVLRTDQGKAHQVAAFTIPAGERVGTWDGLVGGAPAAPGVYLFRVTVRDRAGNLGTTPARIEPGAIPGHPGLTVRAVAVQPPLRPVTAGAKTEFLVDTRGKPYRWTLRRIGAPKSVQRGNGSGFRLDLRAPSGASGIYLLWVKAGAFTTKVPLLVQAQGKSPLLVVVPAITWLGTSQIDDPPWDGVPNTLDDGGPVRWPRVFAGLPADFATQVAPLLVLLDRLHIPYDLTSDLDLALSTNPRASDRPGVLLAGSERWIPDGLARRLRRYVMDGGRLASFGADSLRRGVTLGVDSAGDGGELSRPTQPTATDAFGARLGRLRTTPQPVALTLIDGNPGYGLLTGIVRLPGFSAFEESAPPTGHAKLLAGLGQGNGAQARPALTAVQLGKGLVIRVGLPQWGQQMDEPEVRQVTANIADLLRGSKPKPRFSASP